MNFKQNKTPYRAHNTDQYKFNKNNKNNKLNAQDCYTPPIKKVKVQCEETIEEPKTNLKMFDSFEDFNLKEPLLRGIYGYGFNCPSKIQSYAIPHILQKKDLIAQSQSGTGKTGAFTIGVLSMINEQDTYPQGIIMCNTHELAVQIHSVITDLSKYMNIEIGLLIGGISISKNIEDVKKCQVLVGTPGRISDMLQRKELDTATVKIFVIDEADALLKNEFVQQTKYIITQLHEGTQICVFSATMPEETLEITKFFMPNPEKILVQQEKLSLDLISQYVVDVMYEENKFDTLEDLYGKLSINQCIIYVNSIKKADELQEQLAKNMHVVDVLHSKLDSKTRMDILAKFRRGEFRVLISTDLTCRGIDIQHINYVINYDIPYDVESYLHRIGRSGRFGKLGIAINFVTRRDFGRLKSIERYYNTRILPMPDPEVINNMTQ